MSIKKYVVPLAILALAALMPKASFAAFTSISVNTETAGVTFSGTGAVTINPTITTAGNPAVSASALAWSGVTIGTTQWKLSNQMIVLASTITASNGGVQIYTDNQGTGSSPFTYTGGTGTNPEGLVNSGNTAASPLPMAWMASTSTTTVPSAVDPNAGTTPSYQWFYFMDKNTPVIGSNSAFVNGGDYVRVIDFRGLHEFSGANGYFPGQEGVNGNNGGSTYAPGATQQFFPVGASSTNDIFVEANFASAVTPATYGTNTLRIEAFTE